MAHAPKRGPGRPKEKGLTARRTEEILQVATEVFAESGLRATDVQEIADRCGIAKGTVYRYFPGKDELFLATVRRAVNRLADAARPILAIDDSVQEKVRSLVLSSLRFFDENPSFVEVLILERAEFRDKGRLTFFEFRDILGQEWVRFAKEVESSHAFRYPPSDPRGDVFGELIYGTIFCARYSGAGLSPELRREAICELLVGGMLR